MNRRIHLAALLGCICACATAPEGDRDNGDAAGDNFSADSPFHADASAPHEDVDVIACNTVPSIAPLVSVQQLAESPPTPPSPYVDTNCQLLRPGMYILKSRTFFTGSGSAPLPGLGLISLTLLVIARETSSDPNAANPYFEWSWVETHQASLTSVGTETRSDALVQTTGNDNCFTQTVVQSASCGSPTLGPVGNFFNVGSTLWYYHPYGFASWFDAGIVDEFELLE